MLGDLHRNEGNGNALDQSYTGTAHPYRLLNPGNRILDRRGGRVMETALTAREQRLYDALETMVEVYREGQPNWLDEPRCIVDAIKAMSWVRARHWRGNGRPMKVVMAAEEGE